MDNLSSERFDFSPSIEAYVNAYLETSVKQMNALRRICRNEFQQVASEEDVDFGDEIHRDISEGCIDFLLKQGFTALEVTQNSELIGDYIYLKSTRFESGSNELDYIDRQNTKSR